MYIIMVSSALTQDWLESAKAVMWHPFFPSRLCSSLFFPLVSVPPFFFLSSLFLNGSDVAKVSVEDTIIIMLHNYGGLYSYTGLVGISKSSDVAPFFPLVSVPPFFPLFSVPPLVSVPPFFPSRLCFSLLHLGTQPILEHLPGCAQW